jgi:hypothetical protein
MKSKIYLGVRLVFGAFMIFSGLNGFFNFAPTPPLNEAALGFVMAVVKTGYLMPTVKIMEILFGVALMSNRFVPAALVLFAPIYFNIFMINTFLDSNGLGMAIFLTVMYFTLIALKFDCFKHVLQARHDD